MKLVSNLSCGSRRQFGGFVETLGLPVWLYRNKFDDSAKLWWKIAACWLGSYVEWEGIFSMRKNLRHVFNQPCIAPSSHTPTYGSLSFNLAESLLGCAGKLTSARWVTEGFMLSRGGVRNREGLIKYPWSDDKFKVDNGSKGFNGCMV